MNEDGDSLIAWIRMLVIIYPPTDWIGLFLNVQWKLTTM